MIDNIEAGARVIFKRSLREINVDLPPETPTPALVSAAREASAPVLPMVDRWQLMAMGKPKLTDAERDLMMRQAARAWYYFQFGAEKPPEGGL